MTTRTYQKGDAASIAVYSPCERYRYCLTREWDIAGRRVLFVMLNPSTATESHNDPTVERCERRARFMGGGAMRVVNIFAWRATDPAAMRAVSDPVGPLNDVTLRESAVDWVRGDGDMIIAAWGNHGTHRDRGGDVAGLLAQSQRRIFTFGLTRTGQPWHPLYVDYATAPEPWLPLR